MTDLHVEETLCYGDHVDILIQLILGLYWYSENVSRMKKTEKEFECEDGTRKIVGG